MLDSCLARKNEESDSAGSKETKKVHEMTSKRKLKNDSLRKKFKTHLLQYVQQTLLLKKKLNQKFISQIRIKENKEMLKKTVYQVYKEEFPTEDFEKLRQTIDSNNEIRDFVNKDFIEVTNSFLESKSFKNLLSQIEERESKEYSEKFQKIANEWITYHLEKTPNDRSLAINLSKIKERESNDYSENFEKTAMELITYHLEKKANKSSKHKIATVFTNNYFN